MSTTTNSSTAIGLAPTGADAIFTNGFYQPPLDLFPHLVADNSALAFDATGLIPSLSSPSPSGHNSHSTGGSSQALNASDPSLWGTMPLPNNHHTYGDSRFVHSTAGDACDSFDAADSLLAPFQNNNALIAPQGYGLSSDQNTSPPPALDFGFADYDATLVKYLLESDGTEPFPHPGAAGNESMGCVSTASNDLAMRFERLSLTQNMFRIYHDSMENALSCWLTEQTCPYSTATGATRSIAGSASPVDSLEKEWGPNWSNRICSRVCRLDRVFATFTGRDLTAVENNKASRALFTAIMAFASQWATERQQRTGMFKAFPANVDAFCYHRAANGSVHLIGNLNASGSPAEHFSREDLWNRARHALDASAGISSFRVVFANIVFSLTQRPLHISEHISFLDTLTARSWENQANGRVADDTGTPKIDELHDLFRNDCSPLFLETAVRQLFVLRYKMTCIQRTERVTSRKGSLDRSCYSSSPRSNYQLRGESSQGSNDASQSLLGAEDNETFNLLFWLGVMFDTLTAAMHQRPPVVSDEDSEISCAASLSEPQVPRSENGDDVDPQSIALDHATTKKKPDLWGDLFLRQGAVGQGSNVPRWPCSYTEAAETLCNAAPVKVLFFRRVSRIQTLIYRGSRPAHLERAIQNAFWVYHHWNSAYGRFILDCVMNHNSLPPRIQSWYVVLAGHWHLAGMLLADNLESVDRAEIGLDSQRESRRAMGLVSTLRRENAVAVSSLAHCSLYSQDLSFAKTRQFHDSVNEGAFLTEPWTAVLIRSFIRAGHILLNEVDVSPYAVHLRLDDPSEQARLQCGYCLDALWCLGRKSDMALLAARVLSSCVEDKLRERNSQPHIVIPEFAVHDHLSAIPSGYDCNIPFSSIGPLF